MSYGHKHVSSGDDALRVVYAREQRCKAASVFLSEELGPLPVVLLSVPVSVAFALILGLQWS